jgi:4-hydroxybenzoyl-CoA thioesterase
MPATHEMTVKVTWSEVDPAGIVFYPHFFAWFDRATEALFESIGLPWPAIFPRYAIVGVPIVESGARFASPVRWGDEALVRSTVAEVRDRTFRMEHEVSVGGRRCASGFEVRAWVAVPAAPDGRLEARAMPEEVRSRLAGG